MAKFILKDWYGNNCEFDHDKIFVQDAHGELIPFTQGEKPVFEELNVTDNGRYTPREGVDGFNVVSVDVPAPEIKLQTKTITENGTYHADPSYDGLGSVEVNVKDEGNVFLLSNFEVTGFAEDSKYGAYSKDLTFGTDLDSFGLSIGREYSVGWDDELYTVYAKDTGYIVDEVIEEYGELVTIYHSVFYLGNGALLGIDRLEDSGEPFVILWTQSKGLTIVTTSTAESHVLGLIKRSRPQEIVDMLLESKTITENGTYTADPFYDGLKQVTVDVPIPEVVLQDKTITENGTFTADEGFDGLGSVTVAVEGAGGGSLPVGGYWGSYEDIPRPSSYNWSFFELGGELYAFSSKVTASEGIYYKYKLVDGAWVQLEDETFIDAKIYSIRPVEFNGKLHIVPQSETKYHWTFDGTSVEKKAGFPDYINYTSLFVHNNKLKCFADNTVYAWDEATDAWSAEATLSLDINYAVSYVVDDVVYIINRGSVYVYDNNTLTLYDSGLNSVSYTAPSAVANGKLYYFTSSSTDGHLLYCYDFATKTHSYITKIPNANTNSGCLKSYQNKVLVAPISYQYGTFFQLYEVTE